MPGNSIWLHNFGQGKRTESEKMPFRAIISSPCSASAFQRWKKREVIHSDRQRTSLDQSIKNGQSILRKAKETVRNGGAASVCRLRGRSSTDRHSAHTKSEGLMDAHARETIFVMSRKKTILKISEDAFLCRLLEMP